MAMTDPQQAFADLFERHRAELLRYIRVLSPRRADAEEVLQRTAATLWEKFSEFDPSRDFLPWAARFAYYEVLNARKEFARDRLMFGDPLVSLLVDAAVVSSDAVAVEASQSRAVALDACLAELSEVDRRLLRAKYCDSQSIAQLSGTTGRTAKSLYRRIDRLRELIAACVRRRLEGKQ